MKLLKASFLLAAAAQCNAQSITELGTLGGTDSYAQDFYAVSADGSVVVGYSRNASGYDNAFRWSAGVMTNLGTLGGDESWAYAVSANGSVVVGGAQIASGYERAFRWTSADGMQNLGTLGGDYSDGRAVSADGSVVVGYSNNASGDDNAFRWTSAGGMTNLGTLGGTWAHAQAVSADGSVVVGYSENTSSQDNAFRWSAAGGMENLGTLGGTYTRSRAEAVSADGSVVVGYSQNASREDHAFRWSAGVMTNLGTLGGTSSQADAVSADGSVVVGYAKNASGDDRAFIYSHRVMLDVQDWLGSVSGVNSLLSSALELTRSYTEGAHHRPLAELGRGRSYWVTGDVASSSRSRDLRTRSGEAGATFEPVQNILLGIGAGYGRQERDLANDGSGTIDGQYLLAEADFIQADGGIFSVLVSVGSWNAVTDRGYVTGGGVDSSHGETDLQSTSVRLRYDTPVLTKVLGADIKGYVSGSLSTAQSDAYSETGGSYAGSFGELKQTAEEGRLGFAATRSFSDKFRGRFSAEWIHRFDRNQAVLTATDITSTLELSLPGAPVVRDQARFGFDLDYLMDAKTTLSFSAHAAGRGESADVSGAISIRRAF